MKNIIKNFVAIASVFVVITFLSSCEKDEGKLPDISFKSGAGYTSANATVGQGDTLLIGINAAKTEDKDVLKTFDAAKAYDGGTATSFYNYSIPSGSSEENNYSKDLTIVTRNQAGTEKYTFTIVNRDGLTNQVSLTLTVN